MLCLFLDAFKPEYLKHAPYINSLAKNNLHGELEVPVGFTSIIASFLTATNPDKHKIIDVFDISNSKKQIAGKTAKITNKLTSKLTNKYIATLLNLVKNNRFFYTPLKAGYSAYFKPSLKKAWPQKNSLIMPTLFDVLEKNSISFASIDWPNYYKNRKGKIFFRNTAKNIIKLIKNSKAKFIFAHFLDLETAHKYGVNSIQAMQALKRIDNAVKYLDTKLKPKNLILFSDHGMDDIQSRFDLGAELKKLDLIYGKDYIYFLGSTMARFWFKTKQAREKTINLLKAINHGKILNAKKCNLPEIPLVFLANFKTIFYPNFFNSDYKAMHGWDPKIQKAFYLIKGEKGKKNLKITDLQSYILKTLNIKE